MPPSTSAVDRKEMQESLFDLIHDMIIIIDSEGRILSANNRAVEKSGLDRKYLLEKRLVEVLGTSSQEILAANLRKLTRGIHVQPFEIEILCRKGGSLWTETNATTTRYKEKTAVVLVLRDVTQRKLLQSEIESMARFPIENPNPVLRIDKNGVILVANRSSKMLLDAWSSDVGKSAPEFLRNLVTEAFASGSSKTVDIEFCGRLHEFCFVPIMELGYVNLYGRDVTQRKRVAKELQESELRFRVASELSSDWICEWNINTGRLEWFGSVCQKLGYAPQEFPRTIEAWEKIIHPDDRDRAMTSIKQHVKSREHYSEEYRVRRKDGTYLYVIDRGKTIVDEKENQKWITVSTDITERKSAEEALKRRLETEKTISEVSSCFVNPDNIDDAISSSLANVGLLSGASRAYLFRFRENGTIMDNVHEWCAEGVSPQIKNLQSLSTDRFPWWMTKLRGGEAVQIEDASKMPPEARAEQEVLLKNQGIESLLVVPFSVREELAGFVGFDNVVGPGPWRDSDAVLLKLCSKIIGDALERNCLEDSIRRHSEDLEELVKQRTEELELLNQSITERLMQKIIQIDSLSEVKETVRKAPDITLALNSILDSAVETMDVDVAVILVINKGEGSAKIRSFKSRIEGFQPREDYSLDGPFVELKAIKEGKNTTRILGPEEQSILGMTSMHCALLVSGKETFGLLVLGGKKAQTLDASDLAFLELYAEIASMAFERQALSIEPAREIYKNVERKFPLEFGSSYLVRNDAEKAFEVFSNQVLGGTIGVCLTREFPPRVRKKYGLEKTPVVWITSEKIEGEMTVNSLQEVSILISEFLEKAEGSIVLLDGFEYLITHHGFEAFIHFLHLSRSRFEQHKSILIAPLFEGALDPKELKLIEREMRPLSLGE